MVITLLIFSCQQHGRHFVGKWKDEQRNSYMDISYDGTTWFVETWRVNGRKEKVNATLEDGVLKYELLGGLFTEMGLGRMSICYDKNLDRVYVSGEEYVRIE